MCIAVSLFETLLLVPQQNNFQRGPQIFPDKISRDFRRAVASIRSPLRSVREDIREGRMTSRRNAREATIFRMLCCLQSRRS